VNWPLVRFKDVSKVVTGGTPKKIEANYGGNIPFVTPGDLGVHSDVGVSKVYLTRRGADTVRLLPKGAVMVCCIGATIGKVGIAKTEVTTNQQINSLVFDESTVFPKYGYYYCSTIKEKLVAKSSSTTMPIINKNNFSELEIPLPPLAEQKRIAAILDKADAIRRKRQQAIKLADDFLRSVFLDMFGDPVTNPKGWDVKSIGEFLTIKNGYAFKSEYFCENGENVLLTPGNFYESGGYRCRGEKQKRYSGPVPDGFTLKAGDILLAMTEQAEGLLGSSMVVPSGGVYLHNQRLGLLDFDQCSVGSTFLAHLFNVGSVRKCIHSSATGLKVRHTSTKKIEAIEVGFPKYSMQVEFSKVEKKIRSASAVMSGNVELLENNFYSLNQKAFSGNL